MQVRLSEEGQRHVAAVAPNEERLAQLKQGAPLMLSELVEAYRASGSPLSAPLVDRIAA